MTLRATQKTVLIVYGDVLVRHTVAEYLRSCELRVVEAASTDEAFAVLARLKVDAVIGDAATPGTRSASELVAWVGKQRPKPCIVEIAASVESAARAAARLCRDNAAEGRAMPLRR